MMEQFNLPITLLLALLLTVAATALRLYRDPAPGTAPGQTEQGWNGSVPVEDREVTEATGETALLEAPGKLDLPGVGSQDFDSLEVRRRVEGEVELLSISAVDTGPDLLEALYRFSEGLELRRYGLTPEAEGWRLDLEGTR
ncbi:MAG: hypothetical protein ACOC45_03085 [Alkalispirochaetaceae bacterium]